MTVEAPGPALVLLTPAAEATARAVQAALPGSQLYGQQGRVAAKGLAATFTDMAALLRQLFQENRAIIGFCSSGILMRCLGPLLADKMAEPPVLAISADGASIVPLLGGHRGANKLARQIGDRLGVAPAITTAGDNQLALALDAPPTGWTVPDPGPAKAITAALLADRSVRLIAEGPQPSWLAQRGLRLAESGEATIHATDRAVASAPGYLVLHPATLVVGLGCARDAPAEEAVAAVRTALGEAGLAAESAALVASLELKMDEPAVAAVAEALSVPARFFDAARLSAEEPRLTQASEAVRATVGCPGVAEGAALAGAGPDGELVVGKRVGANVTVAVARARAPIDATSVGRRRGHLTLVGLGPGSAARRTPAAETALGQAACLVGYGPYLDQLGPWAAAKDQRRFSLGEEQARAATAVDEAAQGRDVALVGSGDAGIYGLATLVMEILAHRPAETRRRLSWAVEPGVTAMQMAAARVGGALGHDFCAISLSDLMTPWATIETRLAAAGRGDFVVALYNPTSRRRAGNLARAQAILQGHRGGDAPVVVARNLDRPGESITQTCLAALDEDAVDMLTLVLVGARATQSLPPGPGQPGLYTPRGYHTASQAGEQAS